jgi:circadian clock protein KaiC
MTKILTGIPGLDDVFMGGILKGNSVLIQGTPGAGKTTLGLQFVYHGAKFCDEPGMVITFEEFPQQMYRDAFNFGWDLQALERENKLRIISTSPSVFQRQVQDAQGIIQQQAREMRVQRIFLDSVTHFQRITTDVVQLRELMNSFLNALKQGGFTTLMTQEVPHEERGAVSFEQYVVDTVMRLFVLEVRDLDRKRFLEVLKARGQDFMTGKHSVQIGAQGIRIYPRPMARRAPTDSISAAVADSARRVNTGIGGLDRMLEDGLIEGFSALVAGDPGSGKTNLALQFLAAGVDAGETGLLIALREPPHKIMNSARSIGLNLEQMVKDGNIDILHHSPIQIDPDALYWEVEEVLQKRSIKRVVIDSLTDLEPAFRDDTKRLRDYVYALVDLCSQRNITSIVTRQAGEETADKELVESDLAMVFDTIVALRLRRIQDHIRKTMSLLKVRGSNHDTGVRLFKITSEGLLVETKFEPTSRFLRQLQKV